MDTKTAGNFGDYMGRIRHLLPDMRVARSVYADRSKRDTIEDARTKVAEKLRHNKAYVLDPETVEAPDPVFKKQAADTYAVSVKYGNRYLVGVFDGENYITNVQRDALADLLEVLAEAAETGAFDKYIDPIMQANVQARSKTR